MPEREYAHFSGHPGFVPNVNHPRALTVVGEDAILLKGFPRGFGRLAVQVNPLEIVAVALGLHGGKYAEMRK